MPVYGRSDAELLGKALSDSNAFASFYDRYESAIVGYFGGVPSFVEPGVPRLFGRAGAGDPSTVYAL